ncbi:hypothetical protein B0T16DRAFT_461728 [Cercophora newfieldiana]|uniref:Uncharacterized protein n=1 Tax=Cercophora newfieldiana TaxID=92897 RepID=A0AA40CKD9_9PEZI|nr:hypothetical protein B0T16DRAFT_461728 [Cercophora newfieldiana]
MASAQPRFLIVVHVAGDAPGGMHQIVYGDNNFDVPALDWAQAAIELATSVGARETGGATVTPVGQLTSVVSWSRDMLYLALRQPRFRGAGGVVDLAPLWALRRMTWTGEVRHLAVMVGDGPARVWGRHMSDADLRGLFEAMTALETLYLVVSWAVPPTQWERVGVLPPGFDSQVRVRYGFMPLEIGGWTAGVGTDFVGFQSLLYR